MKKYDKHTPNLKERNHLTFIHKPTGGYRVMTKECSTKNMEIVYPTTPWFLDTSRWGDTRSSEFCRSLSISLFLEIARQLSSAPSLRKTCAQHSKARGKTNGNLGKPYSKHLSDYFVVGPTFLPVFWNPKKSATIKKRSPHPTHTPGIHPKPPQILPILKKPPKTLPTVHSFQYSGVFAAFLLVVLGVFSLFAACVFSLGFAFFCYVPSECTVNPPKCPRTSGDPRLTSRYLEVKGDFQTLWRIFSYCRTGK